jgi:hypothetical protein
LLAVSGQQACHAPCVAGSNIDQPCHGAPVAIGGAFH